MTHIQMEYGWCYYWIYDICSDHEKCQDRRLHFWTIVKRTIKINHEVFSSFKVVPKQWSNVQIFSDFYIYIWGVVEYFFQQILELYNLYRQTTSATNCTPSVFYHWLCWTWYLCRRWQCPWINYQRNWGGCCL